MVMADKDPLTGASRDDILISAEDAEPPGPEERRRDHPAQRARLARRSRAHRPHQAGLSAGALGRRPT